MHLCSTVLSWKICFSLFTKQYLPMPANMIIISLFNLTSINMNLHRLWLYYVNNVTSYRAISYSNNEIGVKNNINNNNNISQCWELSVPSRKTQKSKGLDPTKKILALSLITTVLMRASFRPGVFRAVHGGNLIMSLASCGLLAINNRACITEIGHMICLCERRDPLDVSREA